MVKVSCLVAPYTLRHQEEKPPFAKYPDHLVPSLVKKNNLVLNRPEAGECWTEVCHLLEMLLHVTVPTSKYYFHLHWRGVNDIKHFSDQLGGTEKPG